MATVRSVAKKLRDAMHYEAGKAASPLATTTMPGTIIAVDGQGNATVDLGNGQRAHASLGVGAREGDNVAVEFGGMSAVVTRNTTDPPDNAVARNAEKVADEAAAVAAATGQHFWDDGNGVHVADEERDDWDAEWAEPNHGSIATPTDERPWHNILMNSLGILLRRGLLNLVSITRSAIAFYDGLGNAAANVVAKFGSDGVQIGKLDSQHAVIDSNGLSVLDGGGNLLNVNSVNLVDVRSAAAIAEESASVARSAARTAMTQLSDMEKVVGTVTWIAEHGVFYTAAGSEFDEYATYYGRSNEEWELTEDEVVDPNKTYYARSGSGTGEDPYVYSVVLEPSDDDVATYYELVGADYSPVVEPVAEDVDSYYLLSIDGSVQNYLASHMALTNEGLYLMADWSLFKMLIAPDGVHVIDAVNMDRASYGIETRVGPLSDFHIVINGHRLEFYQGETSASYVSNNQMMMPSAIVRDMLQVGDWAFVAQESGNLSLTWIGDDA